MRSLFLPPLAMSFFLCLHARCAEAATAPFFRMKLDGREWVAQPGTVFGATGVAGLPATNLVLAAAMDEAKTRGLTINLTGFKGPGRYVGGADSVDVTAQFHDDDAKEVFQARYLAANNRSGATFTLVITKAAGTDVEGTFSGTLTSDDGQKVLTITDGSFDTQ